MFLQPFVIGILFILVSVSLVLGQQPSFVDMYMSFTLVLIGGVLFVNALMDFFKRLSIRRAYNG